MSQSFGLVGNTIRLRSGLYFDLADPKPEQFTLEDIAGGLSKICRFGGQIDRFYSVAEHLVMCARTAASDGLSHERQTAVFMHDAPEAFIFDCVKPLKVMLPEYSVIEARIERLIGWKYGIDFEENEETIGVIDRAMLIAERKQLFSGDKVKWTGEDDVRVLNVKFGCWTPDVAESVFLQTARELGIGES